MRYYDLHFRATYHGMRLLIEACERAEGEGVELVGVTLTAQPPKDTGTRTHTRPRRAIDGVIGIDVAKTFLAHVPPGRTFSVRDIGKAFVTSGFNATSASPLLTWAKREGLVEQIAGRRGAYRRLAKDVNTASNVFHRDAAA